MTKSPLGTYLMAHWLRFCVPSAGGQGWTPGQETRIPHAAAKHMCRKEDLLQPK